MPSDSSQPRTPAWRQGVPTTARKREAQPDWRKEPVEVTGAKRWSRKQKLGVGSLAFLTFSALLIAVILWLWPPRPVNLVIVAADYGTNPAVPLNVYGVQ